MTPASLVPPTSSGSRSTGADTTAGPRTSGGLLVIGVGNRDRGDDAVGPVVCDLIESDDAGETRSDVRTLVLEGSVIDLAMHWRCDDRVVVVDATPPAGNPGAISVYAPLSEHLEPPPTLSSHAIDVGAAIEIAKALDRTPSELTVIGIEAADTQHGADLSADVAIAARKVAGRLRADRPF